MSLNTSLCKVSEPTLVDFEWAETDVQKKKNSASILKHKFEAEILKDLWTGFMRMTLTKAYKKASVAQ